MTDSENFNFLNADLPVFLMMRHCNLQHEKPVDVLKNHHPRYNPNNSYDDYRNALPANGSMPVTTAGA